MNDPFINLSYKKIEEILSNINTINIKDAMIDRFKDLNNFIGVSVKNKIYNTFNKELITNNYEDYSLFKKNRLAVKYMKELLEKESSNFLKLDLIYFKMLLY